MIPVMMIGGKGKPHGFGSMSRSSLPQNRNPFSALELENR